MNKILLIIILIAVVVAFVLLVMAASGPEASPLYNINGLYMIKRT